MPTEEKMTIDERRKYLLIMRSRYVAADRKERGRLLTEMGRVTDLDRKTLIRLMKGSLVRQPRRQERGRTYAPQVDDALRIIAESLDYPCAERLTPNLVWMAKHLAHHREMSVTPDMLEQLSRISVSTVRRILQRIGQDQRRLPRRGPERANQIARQIPMRRIPWDEREPGHFETDLVHHGGPSASGEYVHTVQLIDVATGWSERFAVLGRGQLVMEDAFRVVLARLPFELREVHSDNGSEFLNAHLVHFWGPKVTGVTLSRSRPYHKNDNRFVEQKNSTLVRRYLGDLRLDTVAQTRLLNRLYDKMWLFYNFFQPVMRLTQKTYVSEDGRPSSVKRTFDKPKTPFERLCKTGAISKERQEELTRLRDQTNPRQLRNEIYTMLDQLFALPSADPGTVEDVTLTLVMAIAPTTVGATIGFSCGHVDSPQTAAHMSTAPATTTKPKPPLRKGVGAPR